MLTAALATRVVSIALLAALGFGAWKRSRKNTAPPIPQIITTLEGTITLGQESEAAQDIARIALPSPTRAWPAVATSGLIVMGVHHFSQTIVCKDENGRVFQVPMEVASTHATLAMWILRQQP